MNVSINLNLTIETRRVVSVEGNATRSLYKAVALFNGVELMESAQFTVEPDAIHSLMRKLKGV